MFLPFDLLENPLFRGVRRRRERRQRGVACGRGPRWEPLRSFDRRALVVGSAAGNKKGRR